MNENDKIDDAAQGQEDHNSMVESTTDRQIGVVTLTVGVDPKDAKQVSVTDFTEVEELGCRRT